MKQVHRREEKKQECRLKVSLIPRCERKNANSPSTNRINRHQTCGKFRARKLLLTAFFLSSSFFLVPLFLFFPITIAMPLEISEMEGNSSREKLNDHFAPLKIVFARVSRRYRFVSSRF